MEKKNNHKLKILYKCIKANTSTTWQHIMLHIPHQLKYSSPNRLKDTPKNKSLSFGKWRFREQEFGRMGQKQERGKTERATGLG